ncbi:MAG: DNA adenine methylase [Anaerotignum faecicola]
MKAILKYPGSKWRIADWVISFFPEHHSYLEPFFGSGATFFQKKPSNIETINDLDGGVVNFFEWVRRRSGASGESSLFNAVWQAGL